jgi:hypothetical protein
VAIRNAGTAFFTVFVADDQVPFEQLSALIPQTQLLYDPAEARVILSQSTVSCKPRMFRKFATPRARTPVQDLVVELGAFYDDAHPHVGLSWLDFLDQPATASAAASIANDIKK